MSLRTSRLTRSKSSNRWGMIERGQSQYLLGQRGIRSRVNDSLTSPYTRISRRSIGKVVTRLDYQAYSKLAIKTMADIVRAAHTTYGRSSHSPDQSSPGTSLVRSAVHHRLGTVPVGEPSIVIAVSSPHRKEAFRACEFILEEVKVKVQIWKREFYEGEREGEAEWKTNA